MFGTCYHVLGDVAQRIEHRFLPARSGVRFLGGVPSVDACCPSRSPTGVSGERERTPRHRGGPPGEGPAVLLLPVLLLCSRAMHVSDDDHEWISRPEAAKRLGVSLGKLRRMIRDGEVRAEQVPRPQGTAYLVHVPRDLAPAEHVPPSESEEVSTTVDEQMPSTSPARTSELELAQLEALTDTHERLAEAHLMIASLREERGTYRERAAQIQARADDLAQRLAAAEARAARAEAAALRGRRRWWFW